MSYIAHSSNAGFPVAEFDLTQTDRTQKPTPTKKEKRSKGQSSSSSTTEEKLVFSTESAQLKLNKSGSQKDLWKYHVHQVKGSESLSQYTKNLPSFTLHS